VSCATGPAIALSNLNCEDADFDDDDDVDATDFGVFQRCLCEKEAPSDSGGTP